MPWQEPSRCGAVDGWTLCVRQLGEHPRAGGLSVIPAITRVRLVPHPSPTWWQRSSRFGQICICLNRQERKRGIQAVIWNLRISNHRWPTEYFTKGFIRQALGALCVLGGSLFWVSAV